MTRWTPARNWNGWDGRRRPDPVIQAALKSKGRDMARSSYVYTISDRSGSVKHAFTVKHELVSFMRNLPETSLRDRFVTRLRDGGGEPTVMWNALEYLS